MSLNAKPHSPSTEALYDSIFETKFPGLMKAPASAGPAPADQAAQHTAKTHMLSNDFAGHSL